MRKVIPATKQYVASSETTIRNTAKLGRRFLYSHVGRLWVGRRLAKYISTLPATSSRFHSTYAPVNVRKMPARTALKSIEHLLRLTSLLAAPVQILNNVSHLIRGQGRKATPTS